MMNHRLNVWLFGIVMLFSTGLTMGGVLDEVSPIGADGYLAGGLIYDLEGRPTPQCHASTIAETNKGLVAAWFGGAHEKNPDVGIWVSRNIGGEWTAPVLVADGSEGEDQDYPCWNPVLFQPKTGPLMLFYKVGPDPRGWWGMVMTSKDGGKTWSKMRKMGKGPLGHILGPIKNKPIQLADGTILSPTSTEINRDGDTFWKVHFELSSDMGKTWRTVGPVNDGVEFDAIQPTLLSYEDGRLQALCRTRQNVLAETWSDDNGNTWSAMKATELPNPSAGADGVTLTDGRQLLVYNHTVSKGEFPSGRNMLNVALSIDGKSWKPVLTLERDKRQHGYSYPSMIQTRDGLVHIVYTWGRIAVRHVVLDPKQLK